MVRGAVQSILTTNSDYLLDGLPGTLEFLLTPLIDHLGPIDIDELYNAAWMLYNNVDIQGDVDFEELQLMADVHVEVRSIRDFPEG